MQSQTPERMLIILLLLFVDDSLPQSNTTQYVTHTHVTCHSRRHGYRRLAKVSPHTKMRSCTFKVPVRWWCWLKHYSFISLPPSAALGLGSGYAQREYQFKVMAYCICLKDSSMQSCSESCFWTCAFTVQILYATSVHLKLFNNNNNN